MVNSVPRRDFLRSCLSSGAILSTIQLSTAGPNIGTKEGFGPLERKGPAKKVIVVGAGLAGLAAAYELSQAGHEVTVLEVRMRAGGRVRTLREPFADGLYAEAGARLFTDSYTHLLHYAKLFELEYAPMPAEAFATLYHLRGKRLTAKAGEPINWPYGLRGEEQELDPMGLLARYVLPIVREIGDPSRPGFQLDPFLKYDQMTFNELMLSQGASEEAVELVCRTSWFGPGSEATSAMQCLVAFLATFFLGQGFYAFRAGNDELPRAFAEKLHKQIHYGAAVVRINQGPQGIEAVFRQSGVNHTMKAQHLVLAVPFSHLRHMEVNPPFRAEEESLINELEYASVARIYLQLSSRFWEKKQVSGGAYTDLPVMEVVEEPLHRPSTPTRRTILEAFVQGTEAQRLGGMDEGERIEFAIEHLEKVHPGIGRYVEGGTSKFWGHGAWSKFQPGQMTNWLPKVPRANGPLHFAGEHTSMLAGSMEGALEAGWRAAREVNESS